MKLYSELSIHHKINLKYKYFNFKGSIYQNLKSYNFLFSKWVINNSHLPLAFQNNTLPF